MTMLVISACRHFLLFCGLEAQAWGNVAAYARTAMESEPVGSRQSSAWNFAGWRIAVQLRNQRPFSWVGYAPMTHRTKSISRVRFPQSNRSDLCIDKSYVSRTAAGNVPPGPLFVERVPAPRVQPDRAHVTASGFIDAVRANSDTNRALARP